VSPDARWFTGPQREGPPILISTEGAAPRLLTTLTAQDRPLSWSADGRAIIIERDAPENRRATLVVRYELATGTISPLKRVESSRASEHHEPPYCLITPDGQTIVYIVNGSETVLYLVEGLK
jgi:hypothetical protein